MRHLLPSAIALTWVTAFAAPEMLDPLVVDADDGASDDAPNRLARAEAQRAPGNDLLLGRETIEASGAASAAELLEDEAGLPFTSYFGGSGTGTPVLRGFAENASSRVLILVDGQPVSRPDLAATELARYPLEGLEQVELLRGSRTVRYGGGALGGVISLRTRRGDGGLGASGEHAYGSDNTRRHRLSLTLPADDWDLSLQGELEETDGYRVHSGRRANSFQAVLRSPGDRPVRGHWTFSRNELLYENPGALSLGDYLENPRQSFYANFGVEDQYFYDTEGWRASQLVEWDVTDRLALDVRASWSERLREINFGAGSHSDNDLISRHLEPVLTWEGDSVSADFGLRWHRDDLALTRYADLRRTRRLSEADIRRRTYGAFAVVTHRPAADWRLTGGAGWERYELDASNRDLGSPDDPDLNYDQRVTDDNAAFEAALEHDIDTDWSAWLRYDRVYRHPVADEVAGYQGFQLASNFNPDLEPETGHNLELGLRGTPGPLDLSLTGYAQFLSGEIAYDFRRNLNVNLADTRRLGIESRLAYEGDGWRGALDYTGTWANFTAGPDAGERVPLVPRHTFGGSLTWMPREALAFTIGARYVGSSPEGNDFTGSAPPLKSRTIWNARARWAIDESLSLFVRADNLFDKRYASLKFAGQYYPAPGRQVVGGFRWSF